MSDSSTATRELTLKVSESTGKDVGRGLARIDPTDMHQLSAEIGDLVEVVGHKTTVCKLLPAFKEHRGKQRIQIDGIIRENAGAAIGESIVVRRITAPPATEVVLDPLGYTPSNRDLQYIGSLLDGLPMVAGDRVRATLFGNRYADFQVTKTAPQGPVVIASDTLLKIGGASKNEAAPPTTAPAISYEDIGGLRRQLDRVREIVELPALSGVVRATGHRSAQGCAVVGASRLRQDTDCQSRGPRNRGQFFRRQWPGNHP